MHCHTQQGYEQTWGFHAHLPIGSQNILIYNNIINIYTHEN